MRAFGAAVFVKLEAPVDMQPDSGTTIRASSANALAVREGARRCKPAATLRKNDEENVLIWYLPAPIRTCPVSATHIANWSRHTLTAGKHMAVVPGPLPSGPSARLRRQASDPAQKAGRIIVQLPIARNHALKLRREREFRFDSSRLEMNFR